MKPIARHVCAIVLFMFGLTGPAASAEPAPTAANAPLQITPVDDAWRASLPRDADAATEACMQRLPTAAVARADA